MPRHLEKDRLSNLLLQIQGPAVMVQQAAVLCTTLRIRPVIPFPLLLAEEPDDGVDRLPHGGDAPVANLQGHYTYVRLDLDLGLGPVEDPFQHHRSLQLGIRRR